MRPDIACKRWTGMRYSCLRHVHTPVGRSSQRLLNVHPRFHGTQPRPAQSAADSRGHTINNVSASNHTSNRQDARHWLRAILRECTYLPDPKARGYVSQYAISRFRAYDVKIWKDSNKKPIPGFKERIISKEKEARQAVSILKRANEGEMKPLLKVLYMTYGRVGKRRHDLLTPLLVKPAKDECAGDFDNKTEFDQHATGLREGDEQTDSHAAQKNQHLPPALTALARSQRLADPPDRTRPNPRRLRPDIPALNSRMRPMPASRVKNLTKRWYADLLDRLLPPLPTDEWHQLRDLANGRGLPKQPSRRKAPHNMETVANRNETALEMVLMRGSRNVERRVFPSCDAHTITPRYLQRLYALVFKQCPLMEFESETSKWSVTWGKHALGATGEKARSES